MAVGTTAAALLIAGGAFSATTQVMGANQQAKGIQRQAEYNAQIYEQQAAMVLEKKKIQDYQFNREAARARGTIISKTAGKDFNLGIEANYARSGASYMRETGRQQSRLARFSGYSNAFSTILNTGATLGMLNIGNPTGGGYGKSGLTKQQRLTQMNTFKAGRYGR